MDGDEGFLKNLPDDEFRHVLKNLPFKDVGNLRCRSSRLEKRVTNIFKSLFNTFYIKGIVEENAESVSTTLSKAMAKDHSPKKLELEFKDELNAEMSQILLDYMEFITSLAINVKGDEAFFLLQSTVFKSLESLKLVGPYSDDESRVAVCEDMLTNHCQQLMNLEIQDLDHPNISVPTLPVLESLTLWDVEEGAAWTFLEKTRNTISSFSILGTDIKPPTPNPAAYKIQKLEHLSLKMNTSNAFKFVLRNAKNLHSLDLGDASRIPENLKWPQFPKLTELSIGYQDKLLPILSNSRDTLKHLIVDSISSAEEGFAVEMPRLTDMYLIKINHEFINKMLRFNCKGLEFLYLSRISVSNLDDGIRIESMRRVVLGYNNPAYSEEEREKFARMCPNAEVVLRNEENLVKSRDLAKARNTGTGFFRDTKRFIL